MATEMLANPSIPSVKLTAFENQPTKIKQRECEMAQVKFISENIQKASCNGVQENIEDDSTNKLKGQFLFWVKTFINLTKNF